MPYVYSTLTAPNEYAGYERRGDQMSIAKSVRIEGGHGVMNKNFLTPLGVVTEVSKSDLEFLKDNDAFKFHLEGGYLKVVDKKEECEKIAADMARADGSAPITEADYAEGGRAAGQTNAPKTGAVK